MKLRLLPQAAADLEGIALYVADHNPRAAFALVEAIESRFRQILIYPLSGRRRDDLGPRLPTS